MKRGFFGIGIYHGKTVENLGTLWRSAHAFGADFIFTIGRRYKPQASDTTKAWRHVPLWEYQDINQLKAAMPREALLVGVELTTCALPVASFHHPERAVYLLGAEDSGLPPAELAMCHRVIVLPGSRCLNVSVAGSIVLFDRHQKTKIDSFAIAAE